MPRDEPILYYGQTCEIWFEVENKSTTDYDISHVVDMDSKTVCRKPTEHAASDEYHKCKNFNIPK